MMKKRRQLLIVLGGLLLLALITFLGSSLESWLPQKTSAAVQTAQVGAYTVTLLVDPNPPASDRTANLSIQIVATGGHALVSRAHVAVSVTMQEMDMGTEQITATELLQSPGMYHAQAQFAMRGSWLVDVTFSPPGAHAEHVQFSVTAQ